MGITIRAKEIDDEPWFVGKDVAVALGYKNTKDALSKHVDEEDAMGSRIVTPSRGVQTIKFINESGRLFIHNLFKSQPMRINGRLASRMIMPDLFEEF